MIITVLLSLIIILTVIILYRRNKLKPIQTKFKEICKKSRNKNGFIELSQDSDNEFDKHFENFHLRSFTETDLMKRDDNFEKEK